MDTMMGIATDINIKILVIRLANFAVPYRTLA